MADINKINIKNTEYDIKDSVARNMNIVGMYQLNSSTTTATCTITGLTNHGRSETRIYYNNSSSTRTVTVSASSYKTPNNTTITLSVPAYGYCEVNFINYNGTIYARGA